LKITGRLETATHEVHNWVKWPEGKSDPKPLRNVEITSGAIILSLNMSVPGRVHSQDADLKGFGALVQ